MERIMDFIMEKVFLPILVVSMIVAITAMLFAIYFEVTQAKSPTLELYKNEWVCTETAKTKKSIMVGRVLTTQYEDVCVNYKYEYKESK